MLTRAARWRTIRHVDSDVARRKISPRPRYTAQRIPPDHVTGKIRVRVPRVREDGAQRIEEAATKRRRRRAVRHSRGRGRRQCVSARSQCGRGSTPPTPTPSALPVLEDRPGGSQSAFLHRSFRLVHPSDPRRQAAGRNSGEGRGRDTAVFAALFRPNQPGIRAARSANLQSRVRPFRCPQG